jgi:hypothetical protein
MYGLVLCRVSVAVIVPDRVHCGTGCGVVLPNGVTVLAHDQLMVTFTNWGMVPPLTEQ